VFRYSVFGWEILDLESMSLGSFQRCIVSHVIDNGTQASEKLLDVSASHMKKKADREKRKYLPWVYVFRTF
jgi:hypothetical protein